jgi:hypothetical protein
MTVAVGQIWQSGEFYAEVTRTGILTDNHAGDWVRGVEFKGTSSSDVYALTEETFEATYDKVAEGDGAKPPQASQMPADTKPPKPTLY